MRHNAFLIAILLTIAVMAGCTTVAPKQDGVIETPPVEYSAL